MELPIPLEIPWKLAATTQRLLPNGPSDTTISLFYFQPHLETLDTDYPNDYLVYLKFTVTVSPFAKFWEGRIKDLLTGGMPVWSFLFDLTVTPNPMQSGGIRPFFLAGAPLRRAMIETGVVGVDLYEGEANGIAVGKSASQLHETGSSHADTTTEGYTGGNSWPLGSLGFNTQETSTSSSFDRTVTQRVDTTQREASQERRELLSHRTNVENVLSLLEAKHLGSPYLRFMLRPRPLRPLTIDPADPNLWYSQMLARRSSGIEGIQEFFAVIAVPKGTNFCIAADATRIGVIDIPPSPPPFTEFGHPRVEDPTANLRMTEYLSTIYPPGTPLEELDIDIVPATDVPEFPRPVVMHWHLHEENAIVIVASPRPSPYWGEIRLNVYNYKHRYEVWRDMLRWEYERDLARSPLERGFPFAVHLRLDTCFVRDAAGDLQVQNFAFGTALPYDPGIASAESADADSATMQPDRPSTRREAVRRVVEWNAAEQRVMQQLKLLSIDQLRERPLSGVHVVDFALRQWAALRSDDPRNETLASAGPALGLGAAMLRGLGQHGITDLRGLASAIRDASGIEALNARRVHLGQTLSKRELCVLDLKPVAAPLSATEARDLREAIAPRLFATADRPRRRRT